MKSSSVDRGWAWVVLAACFCVNILNTGYIKCFGILFLEVEKEFKTTASMTSLLMGVNAAFSSITALFVLNFVLERVSLRKTTLVGVVTLSTGVLINSFASSVYVLIVSQGILAGSGAAMLYGPGLVHVSNYFRKRRAMATAICSCGVSTGGMLLPPFVQYLISGYGLRGALLIMSGMMLQMLVFVSFYRPIKRDDVNFNLSVIDDDDMTNAVNICEDTSPIGALEKYDEICSRDALKDNDAESSRDAWINYDDVSSMDALKNYGDSSSRDAFQKFNFKGSNGNTKMYEDRSVNDTLKNYDDAGSRNALTNCDITSSMNDVRKYDNDIKTSDGKYDAVNQRIKGEEKMFKSFVEEHDIHYPGQSKCESHPMLPQVDTIKPAKRDETSKTSMLVACLRNWNLSFFRRPLYLLIFGFTSCGFLGVGLFLTFLPPLANEKGLTSTQVAVLLALFNGLELVSRLISSFLAEVSFVKTYHLIALSMLLLGTLNQLTMFFSNFGLMVSYVAVFGLLNGFYPALHPSVIIHFVGIDNFPKVFGFVQVFHGAMMTACYPLMGALRDLTGSYSASFHFLGACKLMSAIFLVLLPVAKRAEQHKQQK